MEQQTSFGVVVYGATAGGVLVAIAAAQEGASVALIEPGRHVGGMVSGGLGRTDYNERRDRSVIGGLALEFYARIARHYGADTWTWRSNTRLAISAYTRGLKPRSCRVHTRLV
ncbi:MAG TPA: FAD-dependent oxidoreductase [Ardenticatenaceae bacterium]